MRFSRSGGHNPWAFFAPRVDLIISETKATASSADRYVRHNRRFSPLVAQPRTESMRDTSVEPPEPQHRNEIAHDATRNAAKPGALARILTSCPGVTLATNIAVLGALAPAYQVALVGHGFARATAISPAGAALLRERYGCLCVMDRPADQLDAAALASLRRRLVAAGTLILDVSAPQGRAELEERLRAAHFWMRQYRMI